MAVRDFVDEKGMKWRVWPVLRSSIHPKTAAEDYLGEKVSEAVINDGQIKITMNNHDTDHSIVADTLVRGGAKLVELREDEIGLEEVFMRVTRGETQ